MNKKIICLTGLIASGKGVAVKYLVEKYGAVGFRFSTIARDILDRLYLPHSRENFQKLFPALLEIFGEDLFSQAMARDIVKSNVDNIIIDGIRRFSDLDNLKVLPGFRLVAIESDAKTRYERLIKRGENVDDRGKTWEQFLEEHKAATEIDIPKLMEVADIKINNDGSLEDLYKQLDQLVK